MSSSLLLKGNRSLIVPWRGSQRRRRRSGNEDPRQRYIDGDCCVLIGERGVGKSVGLGSLAWRQKWVYEVLGTGQDVMGNLVIGDSHIVGERIDCFPHLWVRQLKQGEDEKDREFAARVVEMEERAAAHIQQGHNDACPRVPVASDDNRIIPYIRAGLFQPHRALLLIDEMTRLANSWTAMSRATKELVDFLTQIRKFQCEILGTTQFPRRLAGAVAEQIQWWGLVVPPPGRTRGDLPEYVTVEWYEYHRGGPPLPEVSGTREPEGGHVEVDFTIFADMIETHAQIGEHGVRIGPPAKIYQELAAQVIAAEKRAAALVADAEDAAEDAEREKHAALTTQ